MSAFRQTGFWLQTAAFLLLLASFFIRPIHFRQPIYDAVAVLDITGSMNTRDAFIGGAPASRLALEKAALRDMLAALPCGSRLGLAIFVERRPFLLFEPLETCDNFALLNSEIAAINWQMGWDSESHIALALAAAMPMAGALSADLIFITDGQEEPPLSWTGPPDFAPLRGTTQGLIVGVGGYDFSPIPRFDKSGREIGTWRAGEVPSEKAGLFHGHEYLSAVDEPHLRDLARQSGLSYAHLVNTGQLLPRFAHAVHPRLRDGTLDVRFVPAALALLLLISNYFIATIWSNSKGRKNFFFEKKKQKTFANGV